MMRITLFTIFLPLLSIRSMTLKSLICRIIVPNLSPTSSLAFATSPVSVCLTVSRITLYDFFERRGGSVSYLVSD